MKRRELLRHLRRFGCFLKREGKEHELWCNPQTGHVQAVPRHQETPNLLAKKICRALSIPDP
ncbi:MAG TPA: type II toxin-antitoxin system HicA family toxin [Thermoanaerobaculia bacterium]|nr:type II toxin-antitoxin system HicA family toxin [Thermoanaerobaculia bacterium]